MNFPIRIDASTLPAIIFGGVLILIAFVMAIVVWRIRRSLEPLLEDDLAARTHADRQFRRRIQISVMIAGVGILIPLGDQLDQIFLAFPVLFLVWITSVFVFVTWIVLMALGDWLSTMAYSSIEKSRLRHERTQLEDEIRRYHATKNGTLDDNDDSIEL